MAGRLPRRRIKPGDRINTGIQIDALTWKDFRIFCEQHDLLLGEKVEELIQDFLRNEQTRRGESWPGASASR